MWRLHVIGKLNRFPFTLDGRLLTRLEAQEVDDIAFFYERTGLQSPN